jgi:hypothetical protein
MKSAVLKAQDYLAIKTNWSVLLVCPKAGDQVLGRPIKNQIVVLVYLKASDQLLGWLIENQIVVDHWINSGTTNNVENWIKAGCW